MIDISLGGLSAVGTFLATESLFSAINRGDVYEVKRRDTRTHKGPVVSSLLG